MIKGHIITESPADVTLTFKDGTSKRGIPPSYRYEPFTTQFKVNTIVEENTNPFIVTKTKMGKDGAGNVPTKYEHQNLEQKEDVNQKDRYFHYFESPKTVWGVIEDKSQLVDADNSYTTYGFQYEGTGKDVLKKGQVKSGVYSIIDDNYQNYLLGEMDANGNRSGGYEAEIREKYNLKPNQNLSVDQHTEANDLAREALVKFIKTGWKGDLDKIPAQTRIAASYGLFHMTYTTALSIHQYDKMPEKLNEKRESIDIAVDHLKYLFKARNKFSIEEKNDNWISSFAGQTNSEKALLDKPNPGFEEALQVMYYGWNPGEKDTQNYARYHKKVLVNSEQFLPGRK